LLEKSSISNSEDTINKTLIQIETPKTTLTHRHRHGVHFEWRVWNLNLDVYFYY